MNLFIPDVAYIDPRVSDYNCGKFIIDNLKKFNVPMIHSKKVVIEGESARENYAKAKKTVYISINTEKKLKSCKPSADYQFSLSSSCPGSCEYCYLQTTQGEKPFMKLFANIEDILKVITEHINNNLPSVTSFECGSITDPVALEHLTGNLRKCIEFFGDSPNGRLRVITKFDNVDSFLNINHNGHTKFRFSINTPYIINNFEHNTCSFEERVVAAKKIAMSGYPLGFIIAPIMIYDNWKDDYRQLMDTLKAELKEYTSQITFELIQHRYTIAAKELILARFPNTKLEMIEENRQLKWGPYGKFKYVYPKEKSTEIKQYISELINVNFHNAVIEYFT